MKQKRELAPLIAIAVILLGLTVGSLLTPDRAFSPNENRYLQQKPELTLRTLLSGDFTAKAEDYLSDQIVLRDLWTGSRSVMQRSIGYKDISATWLGADGYYFAKVTEDSFAEESYRKNLEAVGQFFGKNGEKNCHILLAPTPAYVLQDKLPQNSGFFDCAARFDAARDMMGDTLIEADSIWGVTDPYYRTDHHWTAQGAYAAYTDWCGATGHTAKNYPLTAVSETFRGTLYSKVLLPDSVYDTVSVAENVTIRSMDCDGTVRDSIYDMNALTEKDHYKVYMGGNHAKTVIDTGSETGKSLLIVKDSFANSFIPYLVAEYDTITVLDLRYCRENVQSLAESCTDILVLYELTNFASDGNLYKLNLT